MSDKKPKPGTKAFTAYKAELCDQALLIKKKIDKLGQKYGETIVELDEVFNLDDKQYFSELGTVKLEESKSYSIEESKLEDCKKALEESKLVVDDYIVQKTSWNITAKMRALFKEGKLTDFVTVKESRRISIKAS